MSYRQLIRNLRTHPRKAVKIDSVLKQILAHNRDSKTPLPPLPDTEVAPQDNPMFSAFRKQFGDYVRGD